MTVTCPAAVVANPDSSFLEPCSLVTEASVLVDTTPITPGNGTAELDAPVVRAVVGLAALVAAAAGDSVAAVAGPILGFDRELRMKNMF